MEVGVAWCGENQTQSLLVVVVVVVEGVSTSDGSMVVVELGRKHK